MTNQVKTDKAPMAIADPLAPFEKEGMIKLLAPAKVNLFLGIGNKRADGFHEAITVMHALTLHDILHFDHEPNSSGELVVEVRMYAREGLEMSAVANEDNLIFRAIHLLAQSIGRVEGETITIRVEKRIPQKAGLGGGSADAAAALVGAAELWGVDPRSPKVVAVAQKLGADVAFFLHGGCACFEGKGDEFLHELSPMKSPVVLVSPNQGVSTMAAYQKFDENPEMLSSEVTKQALNAKNAADVPFCNNLSLPAQELLPVLKEVSKWAGQQPETQKHILCGSGSATLIMCVNMDDACALVSRAKKCGWWARTAAFSSVRAAIVPKQ